MKTKVMIIGAGPYGISIAYELWEQNIPFVIAGHPLSLWFDHTLDSMSIRSDRHTSEIFTKRGLFDMTTFIKQEYPEIARKILKGRIPNTIFRAYLRDTLHKLPFTIEEQKVTQVTRQGQDYVSQLEDGRQVRSKAVVVATGIENHKVLPGSLQGLRSPNVVHSWNVNDYSHWKDKRILVVGGGQSAAECATHLMENNSITWVLRKKPIFYSEPINLPKPIFKFFLYASPYFYFLPLSFKKKLGKKFVETTITPEMKPYLTSPRIKTVHADVDDLGLQERDGEIVSDKLDASFDGVIAATGFQYKIKGLDFLDEKLMLSINVNRSVPTINFNFETSVTNLYMVGGIVEPAYGPAQRFMMGARHATIKLGKVLSKL
jgi:thioredoxin reductase